MAPVVEFDAVTDVAGTKVVVYKQTMIGLDVFGVTLGRQSNSDSLAIESELSSMRAEVELENL